MHSTHVQWQGECRGTGLTDGTPNDPAQVRAVGLADGTVNDTASAQVAGWIKALLGWGGRGAHPVAEGGTEL